VEFGLMLAVTVLFSPILLFGFFIVNPREEMVVLRFGKYVGTVGREGIRWVHPVGRSLKRIPTRDITLHIDRATVVERNGSPILISAVVVYRVQDTRKAALDVENFNRFIEDQAGAVIKRVSALFPYESPGKTEPCLKSESDEVTRAYMSELQKAVDPAGIRVLNVRLNDLTYAPEIAQAMLMRQQAQALIDARKTIVEGAVSIVRDAIERLHAAGREVTPAQREVLISNLLVVLCSGEHAQPVLQVQATAQT
jgi:regulator of protease activity HflC (stomatin/prohibitin superfamily)